MFCLSNNPSCLDYYEFELAVGPKNTLIIPSYYPWQTAMAPDGSSVMLTGNWMAWQKRSH